MSNKERARRGKPEDTLHCTVSECTGNPLVLTAIVVALVRGDYESINRAVIDFESQEIARIVVES